MAENMNDDQENERGANHIACNLFRNCLRRMNSFRVSEFLCATRLDSARIVKNITRMIGERKFLVDDELTSLARCQWANEEKYDDH